MFQKVLFKKKNQFKYFRLFLIPFIFLIFLIFLIFDSYKSKYFVIPEFKEYFYKIPYDKGGKKIKNLNKKGLHLSDVTEKKINILNDSNLKFSIQVLTNENYDFISNKMNKMINNFDNIFKQNDFYVAIFKSDIKFEYFLLYKNFQSRIEGSNYCEKYVYFLEKCIIVNVQNLN